MQDKKIIVAIDGFSSSGKSTMARQLAREIGYAYVDSGAMYRAVTLYAMRHDLIAPDGTIDMPALIQALPDVHITFRVDPDTKASRTILNGEDVEEKIRTLEVSSLVSPISAVAEVRQVLTQLQRRLGQDKGIVMDGRDIGTTVFPQAEMKVFVDASVEVRAQRRYKELLGKGQNPDYQEVVANITERDHIDRTRKESPLRMADDAIVLNNDHMTLQDQQQFLLNLFRQITGGAS